MSNWMIVPADGDIQHRYHKYIDKVKTKNGKWRYIYKYKTTSNRKYGFGFKAKSKYNKAEKQMNAQRKVLTGILDKKQEEKLATNGKMDAKTLQQYNNAVDNQLKQLARAKDYLDTKWFQYMQTPIGKLQGAIGAGTEILSTLFPTIWHNAKVTASDIKKALTPKKESEWKSGTSYTPPYNTKPKTSSTTTTTTKKATTSTKPASNGTVKVNKNDSLIEKYMKNEMNEYINSENKKKKNKKKSKWEV